jgi:monothiol glutaredoxin
MDENVKQQIQNTIDSSRVVLFMKGSRLFPQCGFSAQLVEVLKRCGVTKFADVNVLTDPAVRQGIKDFSEWPTIPQLYVGGKFIGGCDIVTNLFESGDLQAIVADPAAATEADA